MTNQGNSITDTRFLKELLQWQTFGLRMGDCFVPEDNYANIVGNNKLHKVRLIVSISLISRCFTLILVLSSQLVASAFDAAVPLVITICLLAFAYRAASILRRSSKIWTIDLLQRVFCWLKIGYGTNTGLT